MARWVADDRVSGVLVLFEGRDTAGKGGAIKAIADRLNPRQCRVVALPQAERATSAANGISSATSRICPAPGEIALFDRSWYNRAGVEKVMGFCHRAAGRRRS